ncbi:MAG: tetratricopeptide repeat protein, partial [Sphingobacterium sp.]
MQIGFRNAFNIFTIIGSLLFGTESKAQQNKKHVDPTGYITKYDTTFSGIGPQVYFLPPPRTQGELLADAYNDKLYFQDSIANALDFQQVKEEFRLTGNYRMLKNLLTPEPTSDYEWNTLIDQEVARRNYNGAYGMLNAYAQFSLKKGSVKQAIDLLHSALTHAAKNVPNIDVYTIQYNLANLYLFDKNVKQAGHFQESFLKNAENQKSRLAQAAALIKIALIQAADEDYRSAERNIIRKAIPLLNKVKGYEEKIDAWQALAKIYQTQNKHTEAQWFLIQARDLANSKKYTRQLAEIEYKLASSKHIQYNFRVAQKEFLQAEELAISEDN